LTDQQLKAVKVDLVVSDNVEKANWFMLMLRGIGGLFSDVWTSAAKAVKGWF